MQKGKKSWERYQRQLNLPGVGEEGQEKLLAAKVLVVGTGGLGSPVLYYLAAAGVGTLGLLDMDIVDITNLQRQILHWEKDIGSQKVDSAKKKLQSFNSSIVLKTHSLFLDLQTARELIPQYDIVVSAVDNMATRDIINQVCLELGKVWVNGGVSSYSGIVTTFKPPEGPCYRCLYPEIIPKRKNPIPLLGTLPGVIGVLQAQEVIKLILKIGTPLVGKLLIYDALEARFEQIELKANPNCEFCGTKK